MFPERFIRGIINKENFLTKEGTVKSTLFHFTSKIEREDGHLEESINWYDEEKALALLLSQTKEDGSIKFKAGAAILSRLALDNVRTLPFVKQKLSYERKPIDGNIYHGNLLLSLDTKKDVMLMIASAIALCVLDCKPPSI